MCLNIWIQLLLRATNSILEAKPPHFSKVIYATATSRMAVYWLHDHIPLKVLSLSFKVQGTEDEEWILMDMSQTMLKLSWLVM